jgi:uncharacterized membrane protein YhhN
MIHCVLQHFHLPYVAITKPMLVPLLLLHIILKDNNIGRPAGKFVFYIGLMLAFLGDVQLIIINDTFFLSGMIAFLFVNLFYSYTFLSLAQFRMRKVLPVLGTLILLCFLGEWLMSVIGNELGSYKPAIIAYMIAVSITTITAVNVAGNEKYRETATRFLIPAAIVFVIENGLVALNKFHYSNNKDLYVLVMLTYGLAQFLFVKGVLKAYLQKD